MSSDRSPARSFRDLRLWQKAHEFVLAVYRYSESFPERAKPLAYSDPEREILKKDFHSSRGVPSAVQIL